MIFRHLLNMRSHPTWVRGLKPGISVPPEPPRSSHPTWVRGLKLINKTSLSLKPKSHPTWVRGLKLITAIIKNAVVSRTLRGCVD